ncbi:MAG TPA: hypothetical protein VLY21_03360 [Nitrososphaerales archaeon]|nr:hypothetical protein [Nitrososphaerales archaeon]
MPSKTVTSTFRLDEAAFKAIQEDAKKQNISVNTLVNQLVLSYANYDRIMKRLQLMKIPASVFKAILESASDEGILEAARMAGQGVGKTFVVAMRGAFTLENILEGFRSSANYINAFEYNEYPHADRITITLTHNFGKKGTLFIREWIRSMFSEVHLEPKFLPAEDAVIFEI